MPLPSACYGDPGARRPAVPRSGRRGSGAAGLRDLPGHPIPTRTVRRLQQALLGVPLQSGERVSLHPRRGSSGLRAPGQDQPRARQDRPASAGTAGPGKGTGSRPGFAGFLECLPRAVARAVTRRRSAMTHPVRQDAGEARRAAPQAPARRETGDRHCHGRDGSPGAPTPGRSWHSRGPTRTCPSDASC